MEMKTCCSCKIEKLLIEFYKLKNSKDGHGRMCKNCSKQYSIIYHKKNHQYRKNYYITNKEEISKKQKSYYVNNKDRILEQANHYRDKNREIIRKKSREYSKLDKRKKYVNELQHKRQKTDLQFRFYGRIMKHIRGVENRKDFIDEWYDTIFVYEMYGITYHIDHKIPKSWFKYDTPSIIVNNLNNLQVIDSNYNLSKCDKWADSVCLEYLEIAKKYIKKEYINYLITKTK